MYICRKNAEIKRGFGCKKEEMDRMMKIID